MTPDSQSAALVARARRVIPGGVNSPARAFRTVGGTPRYIAGAAGACLVDEDGVGYLDYVMGWGALLFGHAPACVAQAVARAQRRGVGCGVPHRGEVEFAERLLERLPWAGRVRLANSGTEAVMTAVRLARSATGRAGILKFGGGYHGHTDATLVADHDDGRGLPSAAAGLTAGVARDVWLAPYNDLDAVNRLVSTHGREIAAVIVEPVAANMGVVPPAPGFLAGLRSICTRHGALLIFDEVVTGLRIAAGGAVERYGVTPDLAVYGKVIGGGLPVGAVAGPADLLDRLAPAGPVAHAGTFAGHPLTTAAGIAVLDAIASDPGVYGRLEAAGAALQAGLEDAISRAGHPCTVSRVGSMWTIFFSPAPVFDLSTAQATSRSRFGGFFHALLHRGIHLAPSAVEANFLSAAHTSADIAKTISAAAEALVEAHDHR
jgi:glutamate-1-semialdehyde 2,1-aminomutase